MARKNKKNNSNSGSWIAIIFILGIIGIFMPDDDNDDVKATQTPAPTEYVQNENISTPEPTKKRELSEKEYKSECKELFYDDVFFGKDDLEGELVKLNLFLSEKYYFTTNDMNKTSYKEYYEDYKMNRDFYKCSVLREGEDSYVGKGKVDMWFSDDFNLNPDNYETGQKIKAYGEIVSWRSNTFDGYNKVIFLVKYIE